MAGTTDPAVLADLARGKLRAKLPALRDALTGRFRPHHAFLISQLLAQLDFLEESMEQLSTQIAASIAPFTAELEHLDTIPGVNTLTAEVIIAEIGVDMQRLASRQLGRPLSGAIPERGQAQGRHHPQGQPLAADRARRGRAVRIACHEERLGGPLSPGDAPSRS